MNRSGPSIPVAMLMLFAVISTAALSQVAFADEANDSDSAATTAVEKPSPARTLERGTVTVRIVSPASDKSDTATAAQVCTGVCVAPNMVITCAQAGTDAKIRLTAPGGGQSDATIRVVDEFSGLLLLEAPKLVVTPIASSAKQPTAGDEIYTAAAWGIESPVLARGIVSGVDRTIRIKTSPLLLQCDIRTTDTSSGAAIINSECFLLGIVVAIDSTDTRGGWTYAVPCSHIDRLLRAAREATDKTKVVVLKRRRPLVGMELTGNGETVSVERLVAGGPAEKAGLTVGDQVLEVDGATIRSVYQAVFPSLYKQPGDTMKFRVARTGKDQVTTEHTLEVVLGGGVEIQSLPQQLITQLLEPRLQLEKNAAGQVVSKRPDRPASEVVAPPLPDQPEDPSLASPQQKILMLEKALDRYRLVIEYQQQQLQESRKAQQDNQKRLQELEDQLKTLQK